MASALYIITFSRSRWWIDTDGRQHGPHATRAEAISSAIEAAYVFGEPGVVIEVVAPDHTGRYRVVWNSMRDPYPPPTWVTEETREPIDEHELESGIEQEIAAEQDIAFEPDDAAEPDDRPDPPRPRWTADPGTRPSLTSYGTDEYETDEYEPGIAPPRPMDEQPAQPHPSESGPPLAAGHRDEDRSPQQRSAPFSLILKPPPGYVAKPLSPLSEIPAPPPQGGAGLPVPSWAGNLQHADDDADDEAEDQAFSDAFAEAISESAGQSGPEPDPAHALADVPHEQPEGEQSAEAGELAQSFQLTRDTIAGWSAEAVHYLEAAEAAEQGEGFNPSVLASARRSIVAIRMEIEGLVEASGQTPDKSDDLVNGIAAAVTEMENLIEAMSTAIERLRPFA